MKKKLRLIFSLVLLIISISFVSACSNSSDNKINKPVVYTSFYPIHDLVSQVAGDTIEVRNFMPLDKNPHLWEPTPKDLQRLKDADALFVNGANMEHWVDQVHKNLPDLKIVRLSDSIKLISYKGAAVMGDFQYMAQQIADKDKKYKIDFGHTHEDILRVGFIDNSKNMSREELIKKGKKMMDRKGEIVHQKHNIDVKDGTVYAIEMGHEHGEVYYQLPKSGNWVFISDRISEPLLPYTLQDREKNEDLKVQKLLENSTSGADKITYDPHSWLSLVNAKSYLNSIKNTLSHLYPDNSRQYNKNKVRLVDKLTDLELEYKDKFSRLDRKDFVVTHYAYEYLARDFSLRQFPLQGLVSTEAPSLKTIKKAIDFANYKKINTVFYEYGDDPKSAVSLAEEIHGQAIGLTSMEYETDQMNKNNGHYQDIMKYNLEVLYKSLKEE
ncbi:metal ABC transporter substrate-binding protein [Peptostreptococcus equinus]|uniref:Zinc ABC transporter substrate-binding protein n=1 Tax=Peptostreptococcus equinus TaxID=3003601 RepID=A0ABY7JQA4_9FIRM|nr:zinc ABC transporter substrate-binding protein [Peptostreptococcus sp. CBA3647]WAW15536.1 zinc ABC transporter substrate-binding protein [Peptostreptococcus sp. CBA3647]